MSAQIVASRPKAPRHQAPPEPARPTIVRPNPDALDRLVSPLQKRLARNRRRRTVTLGDMEKVVESPRFISVNDDDHKPITLDATCPEHGTYASAPFQACPVCLLPAVEVGAAVIEDLAATSAVIQAAADRGQMVWSPMPAALDANRAPFVDPDDAPEPLAPGQHDLGLLDCPGCRPEARRGRRAGTSGRPFRYVAGRAERERPRVRDRRHRGDLARRRPLHSPSPRRPEPPGHGHPRGPRQVLSHLAPSVRPGAPGDPMTPAEVRAALRSGELSLDDAETRRLVAKVLGRKSSSAAPAAKSSASAVVLRGALQPPKRYLNAKFLGRTPDGHATWDADGVLIIQRGK